MNVYNVHERALDADPERAGALIDSLSSRHDALWPRHVWPRMEFDRALGVGARGGHGPIRYVVEDYSPGTSVTFRFTAPRGFDGSHCFEIRDAHRRPVILRHTVKMRTRGCATLSWALVYGPMHDALIEDSLAAAEASLGLTPTMRPWPLRVRVLRWIVSGGRARRQVAPRRHGTDREEE
jgi:hypothetical protein